MRARAAWARAAVVLALVLAVDQLTKALVRADIAYGEEDPIFPALKLVHVRNEGVAFGIDVGGAALLIVIIALALIGLLFYFSRHATRPYMWLPTGLLLGGAIGNLIDRVHQGHVTDFLKFPKWPAFNVADVAITVGVVALLLVIEMNDRRERAARPA
ncbi:MAG TPA: signal peptidase II [Solirubrobacteraceae bacterium]|nr:signal peptidase II [Solirubrobacteraceae bacterium]